MSQNLHYLEGRNSPLNFLREDIGAAPYWTQLAPAISTMDPLAADSSGKEPGTSQEWRRGFEPIFILTHELSCSCFFRIFFHHPANEGIERGAGWEPGCWPRLTQPGGETLALGQFAFLSSQRSSEGHFVFEEPLISPKATWRASRYYCNGCPISAITIGNINISSEIFILSDSEEGESFCLLSLSPTWTTGNTDLFQEKSTVNTSKWHPQATNKNYHQSQNKLIKKILTCNFAF